MNSHYVLDPKGSGAPWSRIRSHLDWIVLGVALILVGLQAAGWLIGPPQATEEARDRLDAVSAPLAERMASQSFQNDEWSVAFAREDEERAALFGGAAADLSALKEASLGDPMWPDALAGPRSGGAQQALVLPAPVLLEGDQQPGRNLVRWTMPEGSTVSLHSFQVRRSQKAAAGESRVIATVPADQFEYVDSDVEAGQAYNYWVAVHSEDAAWPGGAGKTSELSNPSSVEAVAQYRIALVGADPATQRVTLRIERWIDERWVPHEQSLAEGDAVDWQAPRTGEPWTSGRSIRKALWKVRDNAEVRQLVRFHPDGRVVVGSGGQPARVQVTRERSVHTVRVFLEGGNLPVAVLGPLEISEP